MPAMVFSQTRMRTHRRKGRKENSKNLCVLYAFALILIARKIYRGHGPLPRLGDVADAGQGFSGRMIVVVSSARVASSMRVKV